MAHLIIICFCLFLFICRWTLVDSRTYPALWFTKMQALQRQNKCIVCLRQYALKSAIRVQYKANRTLRTQEPMRLMNKTVHYHSSNSKIPSVITGYRSVNLHISRQHLQTLTKSAKCFSNVASSPVHLTAEEVFSSDIREEMSCRISQIKVPRSLFKKITRRAGILIPLCTVNDLPAVLLTRRSPNLKAHSGEVRLVLIRLKINQFTNQLTDRPTMVFGLNHPPTNQPTN